MADTLVHVISGLTVRIDRAACIGNQSCLREAPEVFDLDERATVTFVAAPADIERERLLEACRSCPVAALAVLDEAGERLVP